MNLRLTSYVAAFAAVLFAGASIASANSVTWTVDASQSKLTWAIPDTLVNLNGTNATVRIRNQSGSANTWNQGNSAALGGSFTSEYKELSGGPSLTYTGSSVVGVNSGNYRPNAAAFSPVPSADNGTFANTSTAPGVYGAKLRASVSILTVDLGYLSFSNLLYSLAGINALTGSNGNYSFNSNQTSVGVANADLAVQGINALIVGQVVPNTITSFDANPNPLSGTSTITNTGGLNRKLTIPVNLIVPIDFSGAALNITLTGQIVATAVNVPEPSTFMLAGLGFVSLAVCARRRILGR